MGDIFTSDFVFLFFLYNLLVTPPKGSCSGRSCWHSLSELFLESASLHRWPDGGGSLLLKSTTQACGDGEQNDSTRWLYTRNPPPTRLSLNVWCGIYFHLRFSGSSTAPFGTEALARIPGSAEGARHGRASAPGLAGCCSRLSRLAGISGLGASGCQKRTYCGCDMKLSQWNTEHIVCTLFFFATLNKMQVLGMFLMHVYSRMWSHALMLSGHACFSVSWRLFAPVPLLHLHSTRIGLLTSSLTLSFSNLLFGFIFVPWDSSVTGCWCRLAAPPITNKLYNHNWNIIFIPT